MLTNADLTIYNKYYDMNDKCTKYKRSYLQGVNYKISDGVSSLSTQKGPSTKKETIIYIPFFDVYVEGKSYLKPKAYQSLEEVEKDKYFTLNDGDIVVKGIIDFELSEEKGSNIKYLNENYDDVGIINTVVTYDCGSDYMKHWKVVCS